MSAQNRLVSLVEAKVDGEKVIATPIIEIDGVSFAAACPDCGATDRPLVFINDEPHATCSCEPPEEL